MASSGFMRLFQGTRVLATSSAGAVRPLARPLLRAPRRYEATAVSALSYTRVRFASTTATTTSNTSNTSNTKQAANQVVDAANASGTVGGAPVHHHHHHHHNNNHHHHHNQSNELISLQPGRGKPKKKRQSRWRPQRFEDRETYIDPSVWPSLSEAAAASTDYTQPLRPRLDPDIFTGPYRCAAYHAVSATLDLNRLRTWLRTNGLVASYFDDVLHVQYDCAPTLDDSAFMQQIKKLGGSGSDAAAATDLAHDLFVFDNGAMVSWGTTPEEEELWVSQLRDFRTILNRDKEGPVLAPVIDTGLGPPMEDMWFYFSDSPGIVSDNIVLSEGVDKRLLTKQKLAFSYGMARSVTLDTIETLLDRTLDNVATTPHDLQGGVLPSLEVWRKTVAEQLQLRNAVNIHSDMLESPEMYWEEPELEKLFKQMIRNLDVSRRIKIFNERLDYTQEVSEVVQTYSTTRTAHLLEKIIIVLISIEVLFHLMDKSLWWQALTWEDVFGIEPPPPPPPKPPHNNAQ